ncbi:MAG: hypothetical protein D6729_18710 [Deltaproteobacteria bacterium]|nr:MAG: hypothetical protein D6729_18710 [Deltaproteobacteria bacterium]
MNQLKPNPTPLTNVINAESRTGSEDIRNLFCPEYENCLNVAVKKGWPSFSCQECPMFAGGMDTWEDQMESYATQRRVA